MRLLVSIPVEKIVVSGGFTFRLAEVEAEAVRILRSPSGRDRLTGKARGWYYSADVSHPNLAPGAVRLGPRHLPGEQQPLAQPELEPPVFPEGRDWVKVGP